MQAAKQAVADGTQSGAIQNSNRACIDSPSSKNSVTKGKGQIMDNNNSRSSRRKSKQFLASVCRRLATPSGKQSISQKISKGFSELEECILELLRIGAPIDEISWLAMVDKEKLATAQADMRKGLL